LSYKDIEKGGKHTLLLTEAQKERFDKNKALKKDIILELKYDQLKANHSDGFLPLLFAAVGANGVLAGGSAAIANAVKTSQQQSAEEAEIKNTTQKWKK
jgi:hypothetical protein